MEELYAEGVATHGGPESCVDVPRGRGEALTGVRAGQAIEPRNQGSGVPTSLTEAEGNIAGGAKREPSADPAVEEPGHARNLHAREPGDPTVARPADHGAGREGKAKAVSPRCTIVGS